MIFSSNKPIVYDADPIVEFKELQEPITKMMLSINNRSPNFNFFAQALTRIKDKNRDIPLSQLPCPCIKRDEPTISFPEEEYVAGLEGCKTRLHGRFLL